MSPAALHWCKTGGNASSKANLKLLTPTTRKTLENEVTFANYLQKAGYSTAHHGKWHLELDPKEKGYDETDGPLGNGAVREFTSESHPTDIFEITSRATDFIKKSKEANKPFFIQMSYLALHAYRNASQKNIGSFEKIAARQDERDIKRAALTEDLDEGVGLLVSNLEKMGLLENT